MLLAMMAPLFAEPVRHVWFSSLPSRRRWAALLCAAGYLAVWMAAAPAIILISWTLRAGLSAGWALPLAAGAAIAWSASPMSQRARNRCHRFLRIGARGRQADLECLSQGLYSGAMCVATCWPWMIAPMLLTGFWHGIAMVAVSLWLALERILPAREPHWQWPPAISQLLWRHRLRRGRYRVQNV
jgi:predicted metal-binding membrane protein